MKKEKDIRIKVNTATIEANTLQIKIEKLLKDKND